MGKFSVSALDATGGDFVTGFFAELSISESDPETEEEEEAEDRSFE
jgi:hypothetical protein